MIWTEKSEPTYSLLTKKMRNDARRKPPIQVGTVMEEEESNGSIVKEKNESSMTSTSEYLQQNTTFMTRIEDVEDPEPTRTIPNHPPPTPAPPPDANNHPKKQRAMPPDSDKKVATSPAQAIAPQAQTQ